MDPKHLLVVQHTDIEGPGLLAQRFAAQEIGLTRIRPFAGERVPGELGAASALLVLGGPMGVYEAEQYPFLREELRLIERALASGAPVLGICLGSQMLAQVLGARVTRAPKKEIGWRSVTLTESGLVDPLFRGLESTFVSFHWHGDVFDLPKGATSLARSEATEHQAFRYGASTYGLLFHLEVTEEIVSGMIGSFSDELASQGVKPSTLHEGITDHLAALAERADRVFGAWGDMVLEPREAP